jgi:hypothetical protein
MDGMGRDDEEENEKMAKNVFEGERGRERGERGEKGERGEGKGERGERKGGELSIKLKLCLC